MSGGGPAQPVDPYAGFEYRPGPASVSRQHQVEKLAACGIDPALFGAQVDPAFFIGMAIHAGIDSGILAEGNVNMLQSLVQHRPIMLDEPLTVRGRISAVVRVPRGRTIDTDAWFEGSDGARAVSAPRRSLKPDPEKAGERGAGERPAPVVDRVDSLELLAEHRLSPERVRAYSTEGNSIHYEPAAARRAGFRAPIIGGGMGVHFLTAALWAANPPRTLDLDIYFRRPIFWEDRLTVGGLREEGTWRALCLLKDGKVATEARVNRLI